MLLRRFVSAPAAAAPARLATSRAFVTARFGQRLAAPLAACMTPGSQRFFSEDAGGRQEKLKEAFESMDKDFNLASTGFLTRLALVKGFKKFRVLDSVTKDPWEKFKTLKKATAKADKKHWRLGEEAGENHKLSTIYKQAWKEWSKMDLEVKRKEPVVDKLFTESADKVFNQLTGGAEGGQITLEDWMKKLPEEYQASVEVAFTPLPYDPNDPEQQFGDPYGMLTKER